MQLSHSSPKRRLFSVDVTRSALSLFKPRAALLWPTRFFAFIGVDCSGTPFFGSLPNMSDNLACLPLTEMLVLPPFSCACPFLDGVTGALECLLPPLTFAAGFSCSVYSSDILTFLSCDDMLDSGHSSWLSSSTTSSLPSEADPQSPSLMPDELSPSSTSSSLYLVLLFFLAFDFLFCTLTCAFCCASLMSYS